MKKFVFIAYLNDVSKFVSAPKYLCPAGQGGSGDPEPGKDLREREDGFRRCLGQVAKD